MQFHYNPHIWIYLGTAVMLLLAVAYTVNRRIPDRLWIATQAMVIVWCLGFALQISSSELDAATFWYLIANDFVGLKSPIIWFLWSLKVAGKKKWITPFRVTLLFVLPVITDILNLTNSWHNLVYRWMWLDRSGGYPNLQFYAGPWYWVITAYCELLLVGVIAVQINAALKRELLHPKQSFAVATATGGVLLFIALSLIFGQSIIGYYDLTPVAIGLAALSTGLAFRFRVQEAVPVPRNAVLDKLTSAVLILDECNRIMDLNPAAEVFFGIKADKAAGRVFDDAIRDWPELAAAIREKNAKHCELISGERHYEAYISDLIDGRKAAGYIVVIQDVTANKAIQRQLIQHQHAMLVLRERERLARELHDSLGQVLGYTNIQIETVRNLLEAGQLSAANRALVRLSQVVSEANTEVREFIYEVKTTALFKKGFFSALDQCLSHYEEHFNIRVHLNNPDNLTEEDLELSAGVQLFRIIQEALTNVRKHARTDHATITFEKTDSHILVIISDDGAGFDLGDHTDGHFSYGLAVMQERVKQIGGEFRIETAPGRGTTIRVSIPRSAGIFAGAQQEGSEDNAAAEKTNIRILLADDHALFLEGLQNLLTSKGFKVVGTARDGIETLEKARLLHPEMIIMDLQMPRCNGLTAIRLIKAEMPEIKIVMLTISDREQDLFKAIQNGASGYLLKGTRTEDFIRKICDLSSDSAAISPELAARVLEESAPSNGGAPEETDLPDPKEYLSKRQIEILSLIAEGCTYKEVASQLFISERTVKYQMAEIIKLLRLQDRRQAIAYARKAGLVKGQNAKV